ncbi:MAG TPA: hypothetical protein DDX02_03405 [Clostridiaceae bacterium]|jgi:CBS domain containing-hemolysin-like protein|nr:hypothetical protein [Clostridiaceae bacterium]HBG39010.1 hypothetical protein [Clostridiaceae bacterium]HBN27815.1 hypothetical protein [Clostridiaceae bacterium]
MDDDKEYKKKKYYKKKVNNKTLDKKWIISILFWTFILSGSISFFSDLLLANVNIYIACLLLIIIIAIGILFDIIGVAVTAADETPFHSMASRKVKGARTAVKLIRNADKVSNFCNDVIGDVCGIVSGATGAIIVSKILIINDGNYSSVMSLTVSAIIASITVGGKAIGKNFAIRESNNIIYSVAWLIESVKKK